MTGHLAALDSSLNSRVTMLESKLDVRLTRSEGNSGSRTAAMQGEMTLLKWMMATTIALLVTVLFRVFTH